jgi:hypothetical protein
MANLRSLALEVARTLYAGLLVLAAELYWLAGPDFRFRRRMRALRTNAARQQDGLAEPGDREDQAAARERFAAERALFLERLRKRAGLDRDG